MVFEGRATTQTKNAKFAFFEKIQALGFPFLRKGMDTRKVKGYNEKGWIEQFFVFVIIEKQIQF